MVIYLYMSSPLSERIVQTSAQDFLTRRYRRRAKGGRLFSRIEVRTRRKYGGRRADGLLAFRHWVLGTYVVSMEAKSFKTIASMRPVFDAYHFLKNCFYAGITISLLSGAFFAVYKMEDGWLQFLIPVNAFLVGTLIYGLLTYRNYSHRLVGVIRQLEQYPANEQWLAFSQDSLEQMDRQERSDLKKICRNHGIGILKVKPNRKVRILLKARGKWIGNFLKYYANASGIREHFE